MSLTATLDKREFEYLRQTEQINERLCQLEQFVKLDSERITIEFREIRLWREKVDVRLDQLGARLDLFSSELKELREEGEQDRRLMEKILNILETMQAGKKT